MKNFNEYLAFVSYTNGEAAYIDEIGRHENKANAICPFSTMEEAEEALNGLETDSSMGEIGILKNGYPHRTQRINHFGQKMTKKEEIEEDAETLAE